MSDEDSDVGDLLEDLLANDEPEETNPSIKETKLIESELSFLEKETNIPVTNESRHLIKNTTIHNEEIDSSDDEDKRDFENQRYSSSGREIKNILKSNASETNSSYSKTTQNTLGSFKKNHSKELSCSPDPIKKESHDVYCDPIFGLRMINPVVSSAALKERMTGRTPVTVSRIKTHLNTGDLQNDWVIAGVVIHKSAPRSSQKGNQYCIWKVSDLGDGIKTISLFLFGEAYKSFWKTNTGTVIGVLNPGVLDNKDENLNEAALSVDNAQRLMILGISKDMGICKSRKKNGDPCTAVVNLYKCEYCVYHVQQEYNKCARRSDLVGNTGRGVSSLNALKNKVLGKGETIYGGQSFTAIPARRNLKMEAKDKARLELLRNSKSAGIIVQPSKNSPDINRKTTLVELTSKQAKKDAERLAKLRGSMPSIEKRFTGNVVAPSSPIISNSIPVPIASPKAKLHLSLDPKSTVMAIPQLGGGFAGGTIDLSEPITKKRADIAKINAIKWIQRNGAIKKTNPNKVRTTVDEKIERGTKRQREVNEDTEQAAKKKNILSSKFKEIMAASSKHTDLIEKSDEQEKEKYFNKLEIKEKMEEKMLTTFSVDCKAVKCLICKYTAFSASDMCKEQKHPLRVTDAVKRFYKCGDCKNRTVTLDRLPSHSCKNCQSSNWIRTAMMDERRTEVPGSSLSIRGGEEKFIGSIVKNGSLDLLVPESD